MSESEIRAYENKLQISVPEILKPFLRIVNGTNKDGINIYGGKEKPSYTKVFYTYPLDLDLVKINIDRVYDCFGISLSELKKTIYLHCSQFFLTDSF